MPRHDHACRSCAVRFETQTAEPCPCPTCGSHETYWIPQIGNTQGFEGFWHPHLGHEPVEIRSARDLDRELTRRGLHIRESPKRERLARLPKTRREALGRS